MSPASQDRPTRTLHPSSKEDLHAYLKAIRLASSVRNSMDAQRAAANSKRTPVEADSYGRHHPHPPSPPPAANPATDINAQEAGADSGSTAIEADSYGRHHPHPPAPPPANPATDGGREPVPALNQTSNTTKPGPIKPRNSYPSPSPSINTGAWSLSEVKASVAAANLPVLEKTPYGAIFEALNQNHHHHLPPPRIPMDTGAGLVLEDAAADASNPHILAIRNTVKCEAPTNFGQRLACGEYDEIFALGFFVLLLLVIFAWIMKGRKHLTRRLDAESGSAHWPGHLRAPSINSSEAKFKEKMQKAHQEGRHVGEQLGTEQYEPVSWRSASYRAARANGEGNVQNDAGSVVVLLEVDLGEAARDSSNP